MIPVLNIVFDLELENLNSSKNKNSPAIDLGDYNKKVAFQITSNASLEKIKETLSKFSDHKFDQHFNTLYIYILTDKRKKYRKDNIETSSFEFSLNEHVIDSTYLLHRIKTLPLDKLSRLAEIYILEFSDKAFKLPNRDIFLESEVVHNLRNKKKFIGRKNEIFNIEYLIENSEEIIKLVGRPGIGKSSLALELAYRQIQKSSESKNFGVGPFKFFIWIDCKNIDLEIDTFLNQVAININSNYILSLDTKRKISEIFDFSKKNRFFLIVDNFESISTDLEKILDVLFGLPSSSKVLITSRLNNVSQGHTIILDKFSEEMGMEFITDEIKRRGLFVDKDIFKKDIKKLYDATGGNPLAMEWSIAKMSKSSLSFRQIINEIKSGDGDIFKILFENSWQYLSKGSKEIIQYITVFKSSVSQELLRHVSLLDHKEFYTAIEQLNEAFLLDIDYLDVDGTIEIRYGMHSLTMYFVKLKISSFEIEENVYIKSGEYFVEFFRNEENEKLKKKAIDNLKIEVYKIFEIINWLSLNNLYSLTQDLIFEIEEYLLIAGFWDERINYAEMALKASRKLMNSEKQAHFLTIIAGTLSSKQSYKEASLKLQESFQIAVEVNNKSQIARALRSMSVNELRQGNICEAEKIIEGVEELALEANDSRNYVDTLWVVGMIYFEQAKYKESKKKFHLMLKKATEIDWERAVAYSCEYLGMICISQKDYKKALYYFDRGIKIANEFNDIRILAKIVYQKGKLFRELGRLKAAKDLTLQALGLFEKLGMEKEASSAKQLIQKKPSLFYLFKKIYYYKIN